MSIYLLMKTPLKLQRPMTHAMKILMDYYIKIVFEGVRIPFGLKPTIDIKSGVKANHTYFFGEPTAAKPFQIRNHENKADSGNVVSENFENH
ncbi:uncharacterized protein PHALS_07583 [Plasmopara halstedii]|uniref:Uncharacterized protein n=1 Tax=Plasmopara halstedii TaxID=4781 RepID=A0A0P1B5X4_PLAHL|nr:uncharacterized protein PHALS_07583 [Plasmopara halstedii]CEG49842.1 hypothetical protein PHALS_07583 [Plasmopara halstedii]|eukprot:XP_024586211.1 hypothetical protein PHALS_07583 [Plasmopara halstedii]